METRIDISELLARHRTPFYIYDVARMRQQYEKLRQIAGPEWCVAYALKANPHPKVVSAFARWGRHSVVNSAGEAELAMLAGFTPGDVFYLSPGKTRAEILQTLRDGIGLLSVGSWGELLEIDHIAGESGFIAPVGLRLRIPKIRLKAGELFTAAHFGLAPAEIPEIMQTFQILRHVTFRGIHCFPGTQICDAAQVINALECFLDITCKEIAPWITEERNGLWFLFSAGLGVGYYPGENKTDQERLTAGLAHATTRIHRELGSGVRPVLVSGRYLTAAAGSYVVQIIDKKRIRGQTFLVTDGGTHQLSPTFFMGRFLRRPLPVFPVTVGGNTGKSEMMTVTGRLCTPTDILAASVLLPASMAPGDHLMVANTGAYGYSHAVLDFLTHPPPEELVLPVGGVWDGDAHDDGKNS